MVKFSFVIFGQHGKARVLRPVHIRASNDRGWTLCRRHTMNAEAVTYERLGKRMAEALVDTFTCLHCQKHAERFRLERIQSEVGPEMQPRLTVVRNKESA